MVEPHDFKKEEGNKNSEYDDREYERNDLALKEGFGHKIRIIITENI
jgi:hypothetical protein